MKNVAGSFKLCAYALYAIVLTIICAIILSTDLLQNKSYYLPEMFFFFFKLPKQEMIFNRLWLNNKQGHIAATALL